MGSNLCSSHLPVFMSARRIRAHHDPQARLMEAAEHAREYRYTLLLVSSKSEKIDESDIVK